MTTDRATGDRLREIRRIVDIRQKVGALFVAAANGHPTDRYEDEAANMTFTVNPHHLGGIEYAVTLTDSSPGMEQREREVQFYTWPRLRLIDLIIRRKAVHSEVEQAEDEHDEVATKDEHDMETHIQPFAESAHNHARQNLDGMIAHLHAAFPELVQPEEQAGT